MNTRKSAFVLSASCILLSPQIFGIDHELGGGVAERVVTGTSIQISRYEVMPLRMLMVVLAP